MRKYTVKKDPRDFRDLFYRSTRYTRENQLPKRIDLRGRMSPVVDQGYCYIPYRFFRDKGLIFDLWTGR
jgi:hypothetical protein